MAPNRLYVLPSAVIALVVLLVVPAFSVDGNDVLTNTITKDSAAAQASSSSSSQSQANANAGEIHPLPGGPGPVVPPHGGAPPPPPGPGGIPPPGIPGIGGIFPGFGAGAGAGAGFHKSIDFNAGAGAGLGPLLAGLYGLGGPAVPPPAAAVPPPVAGVPDVPPPVDPLLGGGPGYLGMPGFLGPSYIPYSWLGSALGAKGDLLFPIVIFVFVVVGIWTVVQFLLGLIVPLIAGKLALGEGLLAAKKGKFVRSVAAAADPMEAHHDELDHLTHQVHSGIDAQTHKLLQKNDTHTHRNDSKVTSLFK